ncbi:S8 family peptidase [Hymenobacter fodinae]|jgi:hypothetical protein|uniref:S8 family peptidase n=1 Tax=Hymenobacter fodinae TaxID=2510796 RepID=A0A4Z0NZF3_9BACT|nr:S8 family peptidase [Hymenobacter fodinae]TGE03481.1 S8 family peptidase [Hymenobacter fodinae]
MEPKNLPIKLFSKRGTQDERKTEAGGGGPQPSWLLPEDVLEARATEFRQSLGATAQSIAARRPERSFIPAVVQVTVREDAMAKSHRGEVGKIFNRKEEYNFIGLSEDLDFLVKVDSPEHVAFIDHNLERPLAFSIGLSAIDEIRPFQPRIDLPQDTSTPLKVKLVNYQDRQMNAQVESAFEQTLREGQVAYRKTRYTSGLTVFKLEHVRPDTLVTVQEFEALYSIDPMPAYRITLDELSSGLELPVKTPVAGQDYLTVGVLDSGIAPIPHLAPWLDARRYSAYREPEVDRSHGTFVAGVLLYGDELEQRSWVGVGEFKLLDATVFPRPGLEIDEDELLENIQNAVLAHPDVLLWNLSGGGTMECSARDFSDFGKSLDELQQRTGALICKSAGNCTNFVSAAPKRRIPISADSVRSLVVGSVAHSQGPDDLVPEGHASPFSRSGFGPNKLIKPELVHYGGNGGVTAGGRMKLTGVNSFSLTGGVVQQAGTSFSTPRVSALMAGLSHRVAGDFNPLLLKALAIHSAKYHPGLSLSPSDRLRELGFGLPSSVDDIIFNSPHESTLILQDNIVRGGYIEILDFPFPDVLLNDEGQFYGEVTVTLVTDPRLDGNQGAEYCQSNIDVSFGTYDRIRLRDTTKRTISNPIGKLNPYNLLLSSNYAAKFQRYIDHPFTAERQLRDDLGKYHPIKKFAINLQEMTEAHRVRGLTAPKKWYLELKGLFSHAAEAAAAADGEVLSQEFCLIVTIRDPLQRHDVYSSVTRSLTLNNFQHNNIQLRNEVNLNLRNTSGGPAPEPTTE